MEHDDFPAWENALLDADADRALCRMERQSLAATTPTEARPAGDDGRCGMCGKWGHGPYVAGVCAGCQQELTSTTERGW